MASNAYEDTVGTSTVRWPRVYNPVIGLGCPSELGGCGAAPGKLCTREASWNERMKLGRRVLPGGRVEKRCPCRARIKLVQPGLWPDFPDEPPAPRKAESSAEPVVNLDESA